MSAYIDTCSLKWRYLQGPPTKTIDQILDGRYQTVHTSELTILEWSSALAAAFREGGIDKPTFKANELALMTDIASARIVVLPNNPRAIERARYLVEYVGVDHKRSLKTNDSLHLVYARDLAMQLKVRVTFVTNDKRLAAIVTGIPLFTPLLDVLVP